MSNSQMYKNQMESTSYQLLALEDKYQKELHRAQEQI